MSRKANITSTGLQNGLIAGLGSLILMLILYLINIELVLGFWVFLVYVIIVGFKILTAHQIRKAQNNYIRFATGLKSTFLVSVISLLMLTIFNYVLFEFIDPQLVELSKEKAIERTVDVMDLTGASEDDMEDAIDKIEEQNFEPNFKTSALNYASSLLIGFVYSLIIAGIYHFISKDNAPREEEQPESPENSPTA